jgi:hypothetical protein
MTKQQKKALLQALGLKKTICLMIMLMGILVLLPLVNADATWNAKTYDTASKTITIKNYLLGVVPLNTVATLKLKTPIYNVIWGTGYQRVAIIEINNEGEFDKAIQDIDFYKWGFTKLNVKNFDYKYLTYKEVEKDVYKSTCKDVKISSTCTYEKTGTKKVQEEVWNDLDISKPLPKGDITIGIYYPNVKPGEMIEWIPKNWFGVDSINEWATFIGADIVESNLPSMDDRWALGSTASYHVQQQFQVGATGLNLTYNLVGIEIPIIIESGSPTACTICLYTNDGTGVPDKLGSLLVCNYSFDITGISTDVGNPTWLNISMPSTPLEPGIKYWINASGCNNDYARWFGKTFDTYPGVAYMYGAYEAHSRAAFYVWGTLPPNSGNVSTVLLQPPDTSSFNISAIQAIQFKATSNTYVGTGINFTNITLYIWNSTIGEVYKNTVAITGNLSVNTSWLATLYNGTFSWNALTCGLNVSLEPKCAWALSNFTLSVSIIPSNITTTLFTPPNGTSSYLLPVTYNFTAGVKLFVLENINSTFYIWNSSGNNIYKNTALLSIYSNYTNLTQDTINSAWYNIYNGAKQSACVSCSDPSRSLAVRTVGGIPTQIGAYVACSICGQSNLLISSATVAPQDCANANYSNLAGFSSGTVGNYYCIYDDVNNIYTIMNHTEYIGNSNYSLNFLSYTPIAANFSWLYTNTNNGVFNWNVYSCGQTVTATSLCHWATSNWTFSASPLVVNNVTYQSPVIELQPNVITGNFTFGVNPDFVILNYNGVSYTPSVVASGYNYIATSTVVAPNVNSLQNISFNYIISIGGINYTSEIFNQTVIEVVLTTNCVGNYSVLNLLNYDEESLETMNGTVEYALSILTNNNQLALLTGNITGTNVSLCSTQNLSNNYSTYGLQLRFYASGFLYKTYNVQMASTLNLPITIPLYYLNNTIGTQFKINYVDFNYLVYPGAIMQIQRQYLSQNLYNTVEIPILDSNGKTTGSFNTNNIRYKIIIINNGVILDTFNDVFPVCQSVILGTCELTLRGVKPTPVSSVGDFSYTLIKTNTSIVLTFIIPSGTPRTINLITEQSSRFLNNVSNCDVSIFASGGTLTCGYNETIGDSIIAAQIINSDGSHLYSNIQVSEDLSSFYLLNNYLIGFILILDLALIFIASGTLLIIIAVIGILFMGLIFLLRGVDWFTLAGSLGWIVVAAIIIIYRISQKEEKT